VRLCALLLPLVLAFAPTASAELSAHGDLFASFSGGIWPRSLPRDRPSPIAVHLAGTVKTLSGARPPALRAITIALGRGGRLNAAGLPLCFPAEVRSSTDAQALAACGAALVGHGTYLASTAFPEQQAFPARARILAFNSLLDGRPAILAHVYGAEPAPVTRLYQFRISRKSGPYGILLAASLPASSNRYGYLTAISLDLHRTYFYRGLRRSYLSATCATPPGIFRATFPFARAVMRFSDGRHLTARLIRSCRVRH
jgi:hypothetical protein